MNNNCARGKHLDAARIRDAYTVNFSAFYSAVFPALIQGVRTYETEQSSECNRIGSVSEHAWLPDMFSVIFDAFFFAGNLRALLCSSAAGDSHCLLVT